MHMYKPLHSLELVLVFAARQHRNVSLAAAAGGRRRRQRHRPFVVAVGRRALSSSCESPNPCPPLHVLFAFRLSTEFQFRLRRAETATVRITASRHISVDSGDDSLRTALELAAFVGKESPGLKVHCVCAVTLVICVPTTDFSNSSKSSNNHYSRLSLSLSLRRVSTNSALGVRRILIRRRYSSSSL